MSYILVEQTPQDARQFPGGKYPRSVLVRVPKRQLILALGGAGLALLAVGLILTFGGRSTELLISPVYQVGVLAVQEEIPIRCSIANGSNRVLTIIGSYNRCFTDACVWSEDVPKEIPAGGTAEVLVKFKTHRPGHFSVQHTLYTDSAAQPVLVFAIEGAGIPSESKETSQ